MDPNNVKKTFILLWELLRIKNGLIAFFGVFVGATFIYTSGTQIDWAPIGIAGLASFLITGAGNALNDYFDYEIDKINKPKRPIPSGRISRSDAFMLAIVLFLLGWGFSKYINEYCLTIALINSIILIVYAMYSKKLLFLSNLAISFLVASIFVFGVAATLQDGIDILEVSELKMVGILTACAFLTTLAREIIKDVEDIKGDSEKYAVTLPIRIGAGRAKAVAVTFTLLAIIFSLVPLLIDLGAFNRYVYGFIVFIADLVFMLALTMHPTLGQRTMVVGMVLALIAFFLGNITALG